MIKPTLDIQKYVETVVIFCDWCLWPIARGWLLLFLLALIIRTRTTRLLQAAHRISTLPAHVYEEHFAKNEANTVKKLWTRYTIDHQEKGTWESVQLEKDIDKGNFMQTQLTTINGAHDMLHGYGGHGFAIQKPTWAPRGQSTGNSGVSPCITYMRPTID